MAKKRSQYRVRDARTGRFISLNDLSYASIPGYTFNSAGTYLTEESTGRKISRGSQEGRDILNAYFDAIEGIVPTPPVSEFMLEHYEDLKRNAKE